MSERQTNQTAQKTAVPVFYRVPRKNYVSAPTPAGNAVVITTEYYIEDGEKKAKPGQKVDWQGYLNASRDSCDLSSIVARYLSGDVSVINVNPNGGFTGDLASMPTNINEVQDLAARSKAGFENLSDEIKGIFNGSFEQFYNAVLTNTVETKIQGYVAAKEEAAKKAAEAAAEATAATADLKGEK